MAKPVFYNGNKIGDAVNGADAERIFVNHCHKKHEAKLEGITNFHEATYTAYLNELEELTGVKEYKSYCALENHFKFEIYIKGAQPERKYSIDYTLAVNEPCDCCGIAGERLTDFYEEFDSFIDMYEFIENLKRNQETEFYTLNEWSAEGYIEPDYDFNAVSGRIWSKWDKATNLHKRLTLALSKPLI